MIGRRLFRESRTTAVIPIARRRAVADTAAPKPAPALESSFARITRTKALRVAGFIGEAPYFEKHDGGGWSGLSAVMAGDLAAQLAVSLEIVETAIGEAATALQADRVDLVYGLHPTVQRALTLDFSRELFDEDVVLITRAGYAPKRWADIDRPDRRIAVENGTAGATIARRLLDAAAITGFQNRQETLQAVASERSDAFLAPRLAALAALHQISWPGWSVTPLPRLQAPFCIAMRREDDRRLRDVVDAWSQDSNGNGQIRRWLASATGDGGAVSDVPTPARTP